MNVPKRDRVRRRPRFLISFSKAEGERSSTAVELTRLLILSILKVRVDWLAFFAASTYHRGRWCDRESGRCREVEFRLRLIGSCSYQFRDQTQAKLQGEFRMGEPLPMKPRTQFFASPDSCPRGSPTGPMMISYDRVYDLAQDGAHLCQHVADEGRLRRVARGERAGSSQRALCPATWTKPSPLPVLAQYRGL